MDGGLSFKGKNCFDLGLIYVPDISDTFIYTDAPFSAQEQTFDSHQGGYFYGIKTTPKTFTLRFLFQMQHVNSGTMDTWLSFFRKGTSGKLMFRQRPWLYYIATVISFDIKMSNHSNGVITVGMKSYYPYGRYDTKYIPQEVYDYFNSKDSSKTLPDGWTQMGINSIMNNSGLILSDMTPTTDITADGNITAQQSFLLYNGGSQRAALAINIAGDVGDGVTITNETNGQRCKFIAMDSDTLQLNEYLICDGINGKTVKYNTTTGQSQFAFLYHDGGFIQLEPSAPIKRSVSFKLAGSYFISSTDIDEADVGKYLYINNEWIKITDTTINANTFKVQKSYTASANSLTSPLVQMNKITVTPDSSMDLRVLRFQYKPTFR